MRSTARRAIPTTAVLLAASALLAQRLPPLEKVYPGPEQPLPFSHKTHAAQGLTCRQCHPTPDPGDFAEIVGTERCMSCHRTVKPDSSAIRRLAEFHAAGEPIPWEPVYLVPDYVYFSHREHRERADADCADCHGDVAARDALAKERDISMAACMDCHRAKGASNACDYCHEPRGAAIP